jgi:hypothetical protein
MRVLAHSHQELAWSVNRLRNTLREYHPATQEAFGQRPRRCDAHATLGRAHPQIQATLCSRQLQVPALEMCIEACRAT